MMLPVVPFRRPLAPPVQPPDGILNDSVYCLSIVKESSYFYLASDRFRKSQEWYIHRCIGFLFTKEKQMADFLGTAWWSVLMFVAGALIGAPLWKWVSTKLPWNK